MQVIYDPETGIKRLVSPHYNYVFNGRTGEFARWGATFEEDPQVGMLEIFDLEVSTICHGVGAPCAFCYKSNTARGANMSLATFVAIFDLLPQSLTQIAFGVGDLDANPDLAAMFDYCRHNDHNPGVVPNLTINGDRLTPEWVATLARYCGGVAVSVYEPKEIAYEAAAALASAGVPQVALHALLSAETYARCFEILEDMATDPRLAGVRALVLLALKPKGRGEHYHTISDPALYRALFEAAMSRGLSLGFDSCGAPTFLAAVRDHRAFAALAALAESCESDRFSGYANVRGQYWHCSFTEGQPGFEPVDLLDVKDFVQEVWLAPAVRAFRDRLLCAQKRYIGGEECYLCPVYDLYEKPLLDGGKE